ncbi:stage III sporulation protein AG [Pasteuria penetrans]|uniref:stage III sporulation protein AG n=1 Tax=Pasteuria penetrans TaxID=86005 RepID=UPI000F922A40|nr:stage III sporulation protein AG [Pasteuria penetrans]
MTERLGGRDRQRRLVWLVLLGLFGIGLLVFSTITHRNTQPAQEDPPSPPFPTHGPASDHGLDPMLLYEQQYERTLRGVLGKVAGVSDVEIVVNLDSTVEDVVQVDVRDAEQVTTELDQRGGNRSITQHHKDKKTAYVKTRDGEQPVIIKRVKPKVRGVLVVARGVERVAVRATIIEAIQRALEVPAHRIAVLPKGN